MVKKLFFTFLISSALSGLFIALFPLIEIKLPALANGINRFTGNYSGPLFSSNESHGANYFRENSSEITGAMKKEPIFLCHTVIIQIHLLNYICIKKMIKIQF